MVVLNSNPSTLEGEAEKLQQVWGQSLLHISVSLRDTWTCSYLQEKNITLDVQADPWLDGVGA